VLPKGTLLKSVDILLGLKMDEVSSSTDGE